MQSNRGLQLAVEIDAAIDALAAADSESTLVDFAADDSDKKNEETGEEVLDAHADDNGDAHGDGHVVSKATDRDAYGDDAHSDDHSMVVHVTYEDICEY